MSSQLPIIRLSERYSCGTKLSELKSRLVLVCDAGQVTRVRCRKSRVLVRCIEGESLPQRFCLSARLRLATIAAIVHKVGLAPPAPACRDWATLAWLEPRKSQIAWSYRIVWQHGMAGHGSSVAALMRRCRVLQDGLFLLLHCCVCVV